VWQLVACTSTAVDMGQAIWHFVQEFKPLWQNCGVRACCFHRLEPLSSSAPVASLLDLRRQSTSRQSLEALWQYSLIHV
jgi:hypothetical protein